MSRANKSELQALAGAMQSWGWPKALQGLGKAVLFVTDDDILAYLQKAWTGADTVTLLSRDRLADTAPGCAVVVFCRQGELDTVRRLRGLWPSNPVYSGTYDVIPATVAGKRKPAPAPVKFRPLQKSPAVIFSLPGADPEYLADLMQICGLGRPREIIGPAIAAWASMQENFSFLRFMMTVAANAAKEDDFGVIIHGDVLKTLMDGGRLQWKSLVRFLDYANADILYLQRRDKFLQTEVLHILEAQGARSYDGLKGKGGYQPVDLGQFLLSLLALLDTEADFEEYVCQLDRIKMLTTEDVLGNPREVVKDLGIYLGRPITWSGKRPDYAPVLQACPGIRKVQANRRAEIIGRLGLTVNEAGSFETETMSLVREGQAE